jgi:hypothetical protein
MSRRSSDCCSAEPNSAAHSATATSTANSAGSSRLARRSQKPPNPIRPLRSCSSSSSDVMRKPDTTKNTSTPKKPPCIHENPPW